MQLIYRKRRIAAECFSRSIDAGSVARAVLVQARATTLKKVCFEERDGNLHLPLREHAVTRAGLVG